MSSNLTFDSIIHVVSSLEVGGAERFVIDLCQLQASSGFCVAILSFGKKSDPLVAECERIGIKVYHTKRGRFKKWHCAHLAVKCFANIHFHSPYPLKFMLPIMPFLVKKNVIYTRHGADPLAGNSWAWMHKFARFFVNHISFVSQEGADVFTRSHGWHGKTKHVIDNGVNIAEIVVDRKPFNRLRIGSVGRMVELKNQVSLLQALVALDDLMRANIEIHFFGAGPSEQQLKSYVAEHELKDNVFFHGMISDRKAIYNSFDVLAVTSRTEGLSLAIIEAMAHFCPIIASNVGGNPKLVEHKKNGFLFDYNNINELSAFIVQLYNNSDLNQQFSQYSREKIEQQFSLATSAKKYQKLYI
tara:strand:+ start:237 stop:1307 length:1071 start_codon:yes stop_codon:yes gene_type:complete